jgi:ankyrin repeat protein
MGAVENGHADIVRLLVAAGADVHTRDALGISPLQWARIKKHEDVARRFSTPAPRERAREHRPGAHVLKR